MLPQEPQSFQRFSSLALKKRLNGRRESGRLQCDMDSIQDEEMQFGRIGFVDRHFIIHGGGSPPEEQQQKEDNKGSDVESGGEEHNNFAYLLVSSAHSIHRIRSDPQT